MAESTKVDVPLLLETLTFTVEAIFEGILEYLDDEDLTLAEKCAALKVIRDTQARLKEVDVEVARQVIIGMRNDDIYELTVEGIGRFERHKGSQRKNWDHDGLLPRLLALANDERRVLDEDTGEYESHTDAFVRVLKEIAHIDYYRVTPLKARGIKPEDFCDKTTGLPSVVIT